MLGIRNIKELDALKAQAPEAMKAGASEAEIAGTAFEAAAPRAGAAVTHGTHVVAEHA